MKIVLVDEDLYEQLIEDQIWLQALEAAGVDNWEGISYAHELMKQSEG